MKRFSKMLALGMALAFVFGMTVSAAESSNPSVTGGFDEKASASADAGVTLEAVETEVQNAVKEVVESEAVAESLGTYEVKEVLGVWEIEVTAESGKVTFTAPAPGEKQKYVLLQFEDGVLKAVLDVIQLPDGKFEVEIPNAEAMTLALTGNQSALVLVEDTTPDAETPTTTPDNTTNNNTTNNTTNNTNTNQQTTQPAAQPASPAVSPKTGETMPMTGIVAVICLAAAAFCVKKARYNG